MDYAVAHRGEPAQSGAMYGFGAMPDYSAQIGVEDLAKRRTFEVAAGSSRLSDVTPGAIPCIPGLPCIPFPPLPVG